MRNLDTSKVSTQSFVLQDLFNRRIVGQNDAKQTLIDVVENYNSGLHEEDHPAGNALFLGPTGTGKTALVETLCEGLFGNHRAMIKVDCGEFQHSHEVAKLIGSPPGYLGHRETSPALTQARLNQYTTSKCKMSVVLFDEVEKASDALWSLLLGILDKATLTLGDNSVVSFKDTIILMTSNIGSAEMANLARGGFGFSREDEVVGAAYNASLQETAKAAAKRKFSPEFYNRLEHVVVFEALTEDAIEKVMHIQIGLLQNRILQGPKPFFINFTQRAMDKVKMEGYDKAYGARHIKRSLTNLISIPLSRCLSTGQIAEKDEVFVDYRGGDTMYFGVAENGRQFEAHGA